MSLVTANGVGLPTPSTYDVTVADITNAERNANGDMIIERITTKHTIQMHWKYLNATDLATILTAVAPTSSASFSTTYLDPVTNTNKTGNFYVGDRTLGMIDFKGGIARYQNVQLTLIEM